MILPSKKYGLKTIVVFRSIRGVGTLLLATTLMYAFDREDKVSLSNVLNKFKVKI